MCLDESVTSVGVARAAAALGAAGAISVKAARLGGYGQARALHDAARAEGVALTCGGLLETGVGRAANLALAAPARLHPDRRPVGQRPLLRP